MEIKQATETVKQEVTFDYVEVPAEVVKDVCKKAIASYVEEHTGRKVVHVNYDNFLCDVLNPTIAVLGDPK